MVDWNALFVHVIAPMSPAELWKSDGTSSITMTDPTRQCVPSLTATDQPTHTHIYMIIWSTRTFHEQNHFVVVYTHTCTSLSNIVFYGYCTDAYKYLITKYHQEETGASGHTLNISQRRFIFESQYFVNMKSYLNTDLPLVIAGHVVTIYRIYSHYIITVYYRFPVEFNPNYAKLSNVIYKNIKLLQHLNNLGQPALIR